MYFEKPPSTTVYLSSLYLYLLKYMQAAPMLLGLDDHLFTYLFIHSLTHPLSLKFSILQIFQ